MDKVESTDSVLPAPPATKPEITSWIGFLFVALLFVGSGLSSLIYQVVWTRLLVLVFGSTTFATATVLAVFMGGLAAGSFAAGKVADRVSRPFLWYGILEGIIGVWALVVPFLFDAALPVYRAVWQHWHLSVLPFSLIRFLMASVILLVPTTCMGATLPLLSRFVTSALEHVGKHVGTLYAANTGGAVAGAMLAGFYLLPSFGLQVTTVLAALTNFALCASVLASAPRLERARGALPAALPETSRRLPLEIRLAVLAFALSGAVAMVYEVGWTRTLLMVIGSTTYAFSVMLSTFLIGIFLGSFLCARVVDRAREPLAWFAVLQFLVCFFGLFSMARFDYLPWWNLTINAAFPNDPGMALLARFLLAAAILLPLTVCLGAIFPVVVKAATRELKTVGADVGTLYSANTLGAIAGSFLAGFVFVPFFGVERTLVFASVANLIVGVGLLFLVKPVRMSLKFVALAAGVFVAGFLAYQPEIWDRVILLSAQAERRQMVKHKLSYSSFEEWRRWLHDRIDVLFWEDGASSTVGILQYRGSRQRSLVTNGHVDASDGNDMHTQITLAAYPLLFKPDSEDVAVIGWGSGVSVGAATLFPVKSITAIELEPAVLRAARFFHHVNHKPEDKKIVTIEFNDGRNYLLASKRKFDIIVSEPSNPWQAGVCNLFTREYFEICHKRLKNGGIFSFWLQTVEIPPDNLRGILASLNSVFPYNVAMMADGGNCVVLASDRPLVADYKRFKWLMEHTGVTRELGRVGIGSPDAVLARMLVAPDGMAALVTGAALNVDDSNHLEYAVGKTYENRFFSAENRRLIDANAGAPCKLVRLGDMTAQGQARVFASIAQEALIAGLPLRACDWANASLKAAPNAEALRLLGIARLESGRPEEAEELWNKSLVLDPRHVETLQTRGMLRLKQGRPAEARRDFLKVLEFEPTNAAALYHMAQSYADLPVEPAVGGAQFVPATKAQTKEPQTVLRFLKGVTDDNKFVTRHPDVLYMAGVANYQLGNFGEAERLMRQYLSFEPRSVAGSRMLGSILFSRGETGEASSLWFSSYIFSKSSAEQLYAKAKEALKQGQEEKALDLFEQGLELWPGDAEVYNILRGMARSNERANRIVGTLKMLGSYYQRSFVSGGRE